MKHINTLIHLETTSGLFLVDHIINGFIQVLVV